MRVTFSIDSWELKAPFVTSQAEVFAIETLTVFLEDGDHIGRGEALGVDYLGETAQSMSHQVMAFSREIDQGIDRAGLQKLLPRGGARNAIDCALWDLECKQAGKRIWEVAGLPTPEPVCTVYTLSLDDPGAMAREALAHPAFPVLKVKLNDKLVLERLTAIREARPDAQLLIDANGSWSASLLTSIGADLAALNVAMVEQPLPRGADADLARVDVPFPLFADESCQGLAEIDALANRYQGINIKLDKCGGLTEALAMLERTQQLGMETMVGNMLGSSLAMAPGFVLAQQCRWVDLDGPLWQRADRVPPLRFDAGELFAPEAALWG